MGGYSIESLSKYTVVSGSTFVGTMTAVSPVRFIARKIIVKDQIIMRQNVGIRITRFRKVKFKLSAYVTSST